jgi:hypothetical protein
MEIRGLELLRPPVRRRAVAEVEERLLRVVRLGPLLERDRELPVIVRPMLSSIDGLLLPQSSPDCRYGSSAPMNAAAAPRLGNRNSRCVEYGCVYPRVINPCTFARSGGAGTLLVMMRLR